MKETERLKLHEQKEHQRTSGIMAAGSTSNSDEGLSQQHSKQLEAASGLTKEYARTDTHLTSLQFSRLLSHSHLYCA